MPKTMIDNNSKISKVVFLLESTSQPRIIRRIKSIRMNKYDVFIYGIDRNQYNTNVEIDGIKIKIIDNQKNGKQYLRKIINNTLAVKNVLKSHSHEATIFYSFGFALTLSLKLCGCKNYIYEISDVLYGSKKLNSVRWLFKRIDNYLIRKSRLTVLTSGGFLNYFFKTQAPKNVLVQTNKVDFSFLKSERPAHKIPQNTNKLIFGYVGEFRYPNTVFRFARIIGEKYPNYEFHFYGDSYLTNDVKKLSNLFANVKYFGPFKSPGDLSNIYSKLSIIVACYDTQNFNERIAEPNKLYESLYFLKPIIVSKNTFLASRVEQLGCGFTIDASNDHSIISLLNSINSDMIEKIIAKIEEIKSYDMIDNNSAEIITYLQAL